MLQFLKKLDIFVPLATLLRCIACLIDINFLSRFSIFFLFIFLFSLLYQVFCTTHRKAVSNLCGDRVGIN